MAVRIGDREPRIRECRYCGSAVMTGGSIPVCVACRERNNRARWARRHARRKLCDCGSPIALDSVMCKACLMTRPRCVRCKYRLTMFGEQLCALCKLAKPDVRRHAGQCPDGCTVRGPHAHCRGDRTGSCGWVLRAGKTQCEDCRLAQKRHELRARGARASEIAKYRRPYHPGATLARTLYDGGYMKPTEITLWLVSGGDFS